MKKYFILPVLLFLTGLFGSCDYLNVDEYFEDTFQEDSIFASQYNIERYFNGAAELIPEVNKLIEYGNVPGVTGCDEAVSCGDWASLVTVQYSGTNLMNNLITSSSMSGWTWDFYIWDDCYKVIRKVNTILPNIDDVPDMNSFDKMEFRARCRFLRAYAYYLILMQNGPMILLDEEVLNNNEDSEYYARTRNTYDECVDYICSEFEAAADNLDTEFTAMYPYIPTQGAALALAARVRLQAASPSFNGGSSARRFFSDFTRCTDGEYYVSQTYDESKWAVAAAAAKAVIDLGYYELYTIEDSQDIVSLPDNVSTDEFPYGVGLNGGILDPYHSYADMFNGELAVSSNPEFIWNSSTGPGSSNSHMFPLDYGGYSAVSVPQHIVDMYYMADGNDISSASTDYPYQNRPYDETCIQSGDVQLADDFRVSDGTYLAYVNREPRFYVNIGYSNAFWPLTSCTDSGKYNVNIEYWYGANAGKSHATASGVVYNITGYTCKKFINPLDALSGSNAREVSKTFPIIRYAEILLSYVEALNHLSTSYTIDGQTYSRDTEEMAYYFNQIRYRAGLPGVDESDMTSEDDFDEIIQRERMIELFWEGRRYYDVRRWGTITSIENDPLMGCNVDQTEWEGYYQPVAIQHSSILERDFKSKMVLLPIALDETRKNSLLDQNPGW